MQVPYVRKKWIISLFLYKSIKIIKKLNWVINQSRGRGNKTTFIFIFIFLDISFKGSNANLVEIPRKRRSPNPRFHPPLKGRLNPGRNRRLTRKTLVIGLLPLTFAPFIWPINKDFVSWASIGGFSIQKAFPVGLGFSPTATTHSRLNYFLKPRITQAHI